jgi:hypothetical protein
MAAGDIFALNTSLAARLIRCLYIVALILIGIMVLLGVVRGVRIMTFTPRPMPAAAAAPPASGTVMPAPPQGAVPMRPGGRMMMMRRFRRPGMMGPRAPFGFGRNRPVTGAFAIFLTLLRGAITLMVVRVLAEIGLAVLAMPRRQEI